MWHVRGTPGSWPVLVALVLVVSFIGAYAPPFPWGFILSPSATLRVAGLAPWAKVEHTTV
jgi:hypothetical protein